MLQIEQVQRVLLEIGADKVPQILVFNKIDAIPETRLPLQTSDFFELDGQQTARVFLSAQTGTGLAALRALLAQRATVVPVLAARPLQSPVVYEADS
jgi:GTP-binding protein HflX